MCSQTTALDAAHKIIVSWKGLWEANSLLLSHFWILCGSIPWSTRRFLTSFDVILSSGQLSPLLLVTYETAQTIMLDNVQRLNLDNAVQMHAYCTLVESYSIHIITLNIGLHLQGHGAEVLLTMPEAILNSNPSSNQRTKWWTCWHLLAEAALSLHCGSDIQDFAFLVHTFYLPRTVPTRCYH